MRRSLTGQTFALLAAMALTIASASHADAQTRGSRASAAATTPASEDRESDGVNQAYIREHYTKYEYKISMRDGVKLHTAVFVPKDDSTKYPIVLTRTPYGVGPYGVDRYGEPGGAMKNYAKEKFIFAFQDVRGRNGSGGQFVHVRPHNPAKASTSDIDESTD